MSDIIDFSKLTGRDVAAAPVVTFEEAWTQVQTRNMAASQIMEGSGPSIQVLIEQAKQRLASGATKAADQDGLTAVEAVDKSTVKQLHALAAEAKTARDEAAKQYDAIKQVLKDMLGDEATGAEVLTANGVPVATWKRSTTTILNQKAVKQMLPIESYPELYVEQERRTFLLK
jgi:hypothetical protein